MKKSRKVIYIGKFKQAILMVLLLFSLGFVQAQDVLLDKQIKLTEFQGTIKEALDEISKSGGFYFSYSSDINTDKWIEIKSKQQSVRKYLDELFDENKVKYVEKRNKIFILPIKSESENQVITQTIRGRIVDMDSKMPLLGVNIAVSSDGPLRGTVTNENGEFTIENIEVGRHDIQVSCIGYQKRNIPNIILSSGKERIIDIELVESVTDIEEVTIQYEIDKTQPINDLAFISARSFNAEETKYCPGGLDDISRVAVSYPGVWSNNDGQNHIIIRGNSPKGLQWRLEGIEIPNLNHFAEIGSSGGGLSILSSNMMSISDFFTSAFPAEYGNALSGVFDLNIRKGNNQKHEKTFMVSLIGTELMAEGPLKRESDATYICQYRYSTLKIAEKLGVPLESWPVFQDVSFKLHLPTRKLGTFTIFGIGGLSDEKGDSGYKWGSNMGTLGISNSKTLNSKTHIKSIIAFSGWNYTWDQESNIGSFEEPINRKWLSEITEISSKLSVNINRKINARHKLKTGIVLDNTSYKSYMGWYSDTLFQRFINPGHPFHSEDITYENSLSDDSGHANTLQAYSNWKFNITDHLILNSGIHFLKYYLNNDFTIEPRIGIRWNFLNKHTLSAGFGIHSRKESITLYTGTLTLHDGSKIQPNKDLELTKSQHYVVGYNLSLTNLLHFKLEAYYQHLYDIPVYPFPPYFSTINFDWGFEGNILVNGGTAHNKGIEITIERLFSEGYYLMLNGTLYDSKFRNFQDREYHTKYDGSGAFGGIFLKEYKVGKNKQSVFGFGTRVIYTGGFRNLPIDLEQSVAQNRQVNIWDEGFTEKLDNFMRIDLQFNFRRNKLKYTGEWRVDIINVTNRKNPLEYSFDPTTGRIKTNFQNPIIPVLSYRIHF